MKALALTAFLAVLGAPASYSAPFDRFRDCDVCPEMIELPVGTFLMGAPVGELQRGFHWEDGEWRLTGDKPPTFNTREQPVHRVVVDIPFAIGRNEVTYDEWMACVHDGGCNAYIPDGDFWVRNAGGEVVALDIRGTYPVTTVSYLDAQAYVDWLNQKTGTTHYRLPTEAEWEYAARAGTQTPYAQGMDVEKEQVNYGDEDWLAEQANGDPSQILYAHPVRVEELDAANPWGLRHMSGNVAEITSSCETERHLSLSLTSQYLRSSRADIACDRMRRGGHFALFKSLVRVGFRSPIDEDARVSSGGFRVLRELDRPAT